MAATCPLELGARDLETLFEGAEPVAFEDLADHLHLPHGQSGEIGEGALFTKESVSWNTLAARNGL